MSLFSTSIQSLSVHSNVTTEAFNNQKSSASMTNDVTSKLSSIIADTTSSETITEPLSYSNEQISSTKVPEILEQSPSTNI